MLEDFGQRAAAATPLDIVAAAVADSPPPDRNHRLHPLALPGTPSREEKHCEPIVQGKVQSLEQTFGNKILRIKLKCLYTPHENDLGCIVG